SYCLIGFYYLLKVDRLSVPGFVDIGKLITVVIYITTDILNKLGDLIDDVFVLDDLLKLVDYIRRNIDRCYSSIFRSIGIGSIIIIADRSYCLIGFYYLFKVDRLSVPGF